jgi:signal transduction histidine kinase
MNSWTVIKSYIRKHLTLTFLVLAAVCVGLSFIQYHYESPKTEADKLQKRLNLRIEILDDYADKALHTPPTEWIDLFNFPEDMVIYKYVSDTLQSWANLFPVHNDKVDRKHPWYMFHDLSNTHPFNTPLSYLRSEAQYANIGNCWYVIKTFTKGNSKVIAGILINTDYISQNSILQNTINPKLGVDEQYTIVPITLNDSNVISTRDGIPLFSIINTTNNYNASPFTLLRWLAFLFVGFALFAFHSNTRSFKSLIITLTSLISLRIIAFTLSKSTFHGFIFFSPSLYADGGIFDSLGAVVINHIFLFLDILAVFMMRKELISNVKHSGKISQKIKMAAITVAPVFILCYIHFTLKSLILNSSIDLELYNIDGISIYTIISFFTYALLFISLLLSLQFTSIAYNLKNKISLLSRKGILIYLIIISIYSVICVANYGFTKEFERNRSISNKLAIDRDLDLELHFRSIEGLIQEDPIVNLLIAVPNSGDLIKSRIEELYFWSFINKYDIRVTICKPNDLLQIDTHSYPVDCFTFFRKEILEKYGISLGPRSNFYSLNNNNSFINYFGQFSFVKEGKLYNLYLEIDSKKVNESLGYPNTMIDSRAANRKNLPNIYSYAKYYENKLVAYDGKYNYPLINEREYKERYSHHRLNGYVHFVNKTSQEGFVIVSRRIRSIVPYLVTFSYLFIFYSFILYAIFRFKKEKKKKKEIQHTRSFRNKIAYLITTSLVAAIGLMGTGTILFIIKVFEENNTSMMEDKLTSIQTSVSELCKYANSNMDIATQDIVDALKGIALNTQIDINLFSTDGKLIITTKDEVFSQYLVSTRINPEAYQEIFYDNEKQVITREKIATLDYFSLYAPIFNINGKFIAILNIPYFLDISEVKEDATPIIATIVNLFLILILASLLVSGLLSSSIAKPVVMISKKMQDLDISQKGEHISYSVDDELGALVNAYNNMVDDLEESTRKLAESEREQAWKEMARHIAHEIKNPLTPMQLSIQHLIRLKQQNIPNWDDKFYTTAASLLEQINILSQTASEFSSFAKFYNEDNKLFDLVMLIKDQLLFFDNRDNISLEFKSDLAQADVMAKKDQITRVLVNLISNAIQALESNAIGKITITLKKVGLFYSVSIEDNGEGVKEENLIKLFKPNFTTKSSGTGLGLAICKNIVDQSGGEITYRRSSMGGANFTFTLPIYQKG